MMGDLLLYLGLPFGTLAVLGAAFVFMTPWGPPTLAFVANSKAARIAIAAAAMALAVAMACLKAFNVGRSKGRASVDAANRAAAAERRALEVKTAGETDEDLRRELDHWRAR